MRGTKGTLGSTKEATKNRSSGRMVAGSSVKQTGRTSGRTGIVGSSKTSTGKGGTHK